MKLYTLEAFRELLQKELSLDERPDPNDELLLDLGLDSISVFELVLLVESKLEGPELDIDALDSLRTVSDLYRLYSQGVGSH